MIMKLYKFASLAFVLFFTVSLYAQIEPAEAPMFGNVRSFPNNTNTVMLNPDLVHDFGKIKGAPQTFNFVLKNTGKSVMDVIDIKIPAKVTITIIDLHIQPGKEGIFKATIDPSVMESGMFSTWFVVTTQQSEPGEMIVKETTFNMSGEIVK
jgi:hypothetical protein